MVSKLTSAELAQAAKDLPQWSVSESGVTRTYSFRTFPAAIEFVRTVADEAEAMNHHPDIDIRWRKVTFALVTHSEGGVTKLDTRLAARMDELYPH